MWAFQNNGPEALFAPVDASTAQVIISHAVVVVQKERQFFLALFAHSWHRFFSFVLKNEKRHGEFEIFRGAM